MEGDLPIYIRNELTYPQCKLLTERQNFSRSLATPRAQAIYAPRSA